MNTRERFHAIMQRRPFDRLPVLEWAGWWDKTLNRWYKEGLPLYVTGRYELCRFFGLDMYKQDWFRAQSHDCPQPETYGGGIIEDEKDYLRIKPYLYPADCVDLQRWMRWAVEQERGESVLWFAVDGFFWFPRSLLGIERHLYAFFDRPELLHRINADLSAWILHAVDRVCSFCIPDFMAFGEDLSCNHGPMISEKLFNEFLRPYYDRVIPALHERGIIPFVDTDGDVRMVARWFEEAGVEGMLPLERRPDVEVSKLRKEHPGMKFIGHFDKKVISRDETAVRKEFQRLLPTASLGGFLPACDHQIPPEVSYDNYLAYLEIFRECAEKAS